MKKAVAYLTPFMEEEKAELAKLGQVVKTQGKIVLATVKGDVHDIGKNIVGVVLACNNYEVIDMGVMVSCEKILERAREVKADLIGLEWTHHAVAGRDDARCARNGAPWLQVAAAHRRGHDQQSSHSDQDRAALQRARRTRPRCQPRGARHDQFAERGKPQFVATHRAEYEALRQAHSGPARKLLTIEEARANRTPIVWRAEDIPTPAFTGIRILEDFPLAELREYIDWTPFFYTWELKGIYPRIFEDESLAHRRSSYSTKHKCCSIASSSRSCLPRAVYGFFPANAVGDDVRALRRRGTKTRARTYAFSCGNSRASPPARAVRFQISWPQRDGPRRSPRWFCRNRGYRSKRVV